jgi:hypothetical protein
MWPWIVWCEAAFTYIWTKKPAAFYICVKHSEESVVYLERHLIISINCPPKKYRSDIMPTLLNSERILTPISWHNLLPTIEE